MRYAVAGDGGIPLVFVHGWCGTWQLFDELLSSFSARGRRVVALDLRGHGNSDWPVGTTLVTMDEFAADVLTVAADAGCARPVVVGHSMGALVALACAGRPDDVAAAALLDPAPILSAAGKVSYDRWAGRVLTDESGSWRRRFAAKLMLDSDVERRDEIGETMAATVPEVAAAAARGMAAFDGAAALRAVSVPTLVVDAADPEPGVDELAPGLWRARTVGAGHFVHVHAFDQVAAMIDRFVEVAVAPRDG